MGYHSIFQIYILFLPKVFAKDCQWGNYLRAKTKWGNIVVFFPSDMTIDSHIRKIAGFWPTIRCTNERGISSKGSIQQSEVDEKNLKQL